MNASRRQSIKDADLVTFPPGDPEDPRNWPQWRKVLAWLPIVFIDYSVSWIASGFSPASTKFARDMHVSSEVATLGLSMTVIGFAFGPMTLAPLSEYFGRIPIYIISYGINLLFILGSALVPNLGGFLVLRLLQGLFCAVTIANLGGTIADLYEPLHTGIPMSIFLWAATGGSSTGYFLLSFVAEYRPWRDVFWALLGICGGLYLIMTSSLLYCGETRHSVLLNRRAKMERERTGNESIDVSDDMKRHGMKELFSVALTRPFRFLFTEVIIIFGALFNGYLYGLTFLFNDAFSLVFGPTGHGFNVVGVGLSFLGIYVGCTIGLFTNLWQERYYQRRVKATGGKVIPEARVQLGKVAGVGEIILCCKFTSSAEAHEVFPISLFWFAWTTYPTVHYIVPIIASAFWGWSFYTLILMTYTYTEDTYKTYSASALAALGIIRNLAGAGFPLFGAQMFESLGYQWAASTLAFLAILLVPIPFVFERYGRRLRLKSPWAREHMEDVDDEERVNDEKTTLKH